MKSAISPLIGLLFIVMALPAWWPAFAQAPPPTPTPSPFAPQQASVLTQPQVSASIKNDASLPLRDITPDPASQAPAARQLPRLSRPSAVAAPDAGIGVLALDPVLQDWPGTPTMPSPIRSFAGIGNRNGAVPPDTNGDVGPNHYVQWVNLSFQIWDKSGNSLYGPASGNTLWSGFGGPCQTTNDGDPIVLYDPLADRWLMSQFALPNYPNGPFYQCIAISQTPDPTGAWYRYAFQVSATKMNDYPKFGVWPDGYYMSVNQFGAGSGQPWAGAGVFAFDRAKMLAGQPASFVYFDLYGVNPSYGGLLPADLDGPTPPPLGSPNYFAAVDDNAAGFPTDVFHIWKFHVDWSNTANSTLTGPTDLTTAAFDWN